MTILYAPFARAMPQLAGKPSPKSYPFAKELADLIVARHTLVQLGGQEDEELTPDFRKNLSFDEVGKLISTCDTAVCVDSYLQHHCWYLNKKAIVLWGISDPLIFGHPIHDNLLVSRSFLRPNQFDLYYSNEHNPGAFVLPEVVLETINTLEVK